MTVTTRAGVLFELTVLGTPAPQGSKSKGKNGEMYESSALLKPWRDRVHTYACQVLNLRGRRGFPLAGALEVDLVLSLARPKSHMGTGRYGRRVLASAPAFPAVKPDLSKLVRSTEDALTTARVWRDDAQVVAYGRLAKVYVLARDPDALTEPGAVIRIRAAEGER
ncbi:RusA family crossover junction endodeoxyribonuclease [Streptomonospora litoralis]|uniref:Uncharacterized protein n=1 Tax=Streptomonospora litoralis TaxID=2498135 RepID=A0A4P6QB36_9ACTN|nr:RusA family crossover junction endodeoxyribonuclease [Streptomonospora litoralis]QBI56869.1 hypothetical protein EKD16_25645 [Streptomonospora litoralis]